MEGKGKTRLRNEQASENKSKVRSRTEQKEAQKQKYYFLSTGFQKTCPGGFKLRSDDLDLFNLRVPPFPFLALTLVAVSASRDFLLFPQICLKGRSGRNVVVRLRNQWEKAMIPASHHPITASPPKSFSCSFAGNAESKGSEAVLF